MLNKPKTALFNFYSNKAFDRQVKLLNYGIINKKNYVLCDLKDTIHTRLSNYP